MIRGGNLAFVTSAGISITPSTSQLLLLEGDIEGELEATGDGIEKSGESGEEDNGEISLHALKGMTNNKIIKWRERLRKVTCQFSLTTEALTAS